MVTKDSKNILIADDSLFFRTKLSDILAEAGHTSRAVNDGLEAIEEIKTGKTAIDLLILDLQMPKIDGFGVLKWIQENNLSGKFPVLVITGAYEASEIIEKLKSLDAAGFMSKGLSPEQIIFRVNRLIFTEKAARGVQRDRVAVNIPVEFALKDAKHSGVIISLSSTGAYLHTSTELKVGASISMTFSLPRSEKTLTVTGVVRWFPPDAASKQLFTGYGVNFTSINHDAQEDIKDFISEEIAAIELILHM